MDPKVKTAINGLPFTTEGYQRAKNILKSKYGQMSDIVNAYVQNIMELPMKERSMSSTKSCCLTCSLWRHSVN